MPGKPHIVIGICGSIAAFKIAVLHRHLRDHVEVTVAMTPSATQFIGAQTFLALTGNPYNTLGAHAQQAQAHRPRR